MRHVLSLFLLNALVPALAPAKSLETLPTPAPADSQCSSLTRAPDGTLHLTYYGPAPANTAPNSRTLKSVPLVISVCGPKRKPD
jgi:hypothetical protein